MANHIIDDYGRDQIAVGAPGSLARAQVQFPKLISRISGLHMEAFSYKINCDDDIIRSMIDAGVEGKLEAESVIDAVVSQLSDDFPGDKMERIPAMFISEKARAKAQLTTNAIASGR